MGVTPQKTFMFFVFFHEITCPAIGVAPYPSHYAGALCAVGLSRGPALVAPGDFLRIDAQVG